MNQATATDLAFEEETTSINESFQGDMERFSNCIADCIRSTDSFLTDPINRGQVGRFRISRITAGLFVLIVSLTLALNISMLGAGASIVQLLICNAGLVILNLLASICIASDLARGKTHFLSERSHLARQFHDLSDHMRDLLDERKKWIDALNRCKWSIDAERLKAQLAEQEHECAAQELQRTEDKLANVKLALAEKQTELSAIEVQRVAASIEFQKSVKECDAAVAETNQLKADNESLGIQIAEHSATLAASQATCLAKAAELEKIEFECESVADQQRKCEVELTRIQIELKEAESLLSAQRSEQAESIAQFEAQIDQLQLERTSIEAQVQVFAQTKGELQLEITESQNNLDLLRFEQQQELARIAADIATAKSDLQTQKRDIEAALSSIDALGSTKTQLESEVNQNREKLLELHTKAGYAQHCNVQLINEAISLELQSAQHRETFASAEAELEGIEQELREKKTVLDQLRTDELKVELRIANLLTQADKLECLAVATSTSISDAQAQQQNAASTTVAGLQEQKTLLENELLELQKQMQADAALTVQYADAALQSQNTAAKAVADAERRVSMLSEKSDSLAEQVQARAGELFAVKQELVELRVEVRDLEATKLEFREVDQELEGLKVQLASQRAQIASANSQIADADAVIQSRQMAANALEQRISDLDTQLQNAVCQYNDHEQSVARLMLDHDVIAVQNQLLVAQQAELTVAIAQTLDSKNLAAQELVDLVEQAKNQNEQIQQFAMERAAIEHDVTAATAALQVLLAQKIQLECETGKIHDLLVQREALEDQVSSLTAHIESLTQQQSTAIEQANAHQQTLLETDLKLHTLRELLDELELQHANSIASNASAEDELARTLQLQQAASEDYNAAVQQSTAVQGEINALQAQLESLGNQRFKASSELQQVIDEVSDAQLVAKQWTTYLDSLNSDVESQQKMHSEIQSSIDALRTDESRAMLERQQTTNEIELLLQQQASLRSSNKHEELTLHENQLAVDKSSSQLSGLQSQMIDVTEQIAELERLARIANQELRSVEEAIDAAERSKDAVDKQIIERQTQIDQISVAHEGQLDHIRDLAEEQAYLESTMLELSRRITASESEAAKLESSKQLLQQDLHQQQMSREIAIEQKSAIESEILVLKTELAGLQQTQVELVRIESICLERTAALNTLCKESAVEQSRLNDLKEQVVASEASLDTVKSQQASAELLHATLEQQNNSLRGSLTEAEAELNETLESKAALARLIETMDAQLKQLADDRSSTEGKLRQISDHLTAKSSHLEQTESDIKVAESRAHEVWATVSELQELHSDLDQALALKRDEIGAAKAEMVKYDQLRMSLLAQSDSIQAAVTESNMQLQECQNAKRELEKNISTLNIHMEQLQTEIDSANTHLELITQKVTAAASVDSSSDLPEALEAASETPDLSEAETMEPAKALNVEVEMVIPERLVQQTQNQEDDIWTSLGELARMSDAMRVDLVPVDVVRTGKLEAGKPLAPLVALEVTAPSTKPSVDEWEVVFAPSKAQRRAL